jgi:hypothetical protein
VRNLARPHCNCNRHRVGSHLGGADGSWKQPNDRAPRESYRIQRDSFHDGHRSVRIKWDCFHHRHVSPRTALILLAASLHRQ